MAASSHMQRTLKSFRDAGLTAEKVEHWNHYAKRRQDLLGVFDILVLSDVILGVQVTDTHNLAAHVAKIQESENAKLWLKANGKIQLWAWWRKVPRGRWNRRVFSLTFNGITWSQTELFQ